MANNNDLQKLIDICFEIALTMHTNKKFFENKKMDEVGDWVAVQLRKSGFDTIPTGISWGVLKK